MFTKVKVKSILLAFFTTLAFASSTSIISNDEIKSFISSTNPIYYKELLNTVLNNALLRGLMIIQLNYQSVFSVLFSILFIAFYAYYKKLSTMIDDGTNSKNAKFVSLILSLFYAVTFLVGRSFIYTNSFDLLTFSITYFAISVINFIGIFSLFYISIINLLNWLDDKYIQRGDTPFNFSKKSLFFFSVPFLFLAWFPYIIIFFPGNINMDALNQIQQGMGYLPLNANHPLIPTFFFTFFIKLGRFFGSDNLGLFLITFTQIILAVLLISEVLAYFTSKLQNRVVYFSTLSFFAFFPFWPLRFYVVEKDTIFFLSCLAFIYFIMRYQEQISANKFKYLIPYYFASLVMCSFRESSKMKLAT